MVEIQTKTSDLPLVAFTADIVAGLTGLSVSQLHRWDRTGFFHPSLADPNRRRPYSRIYSLLDVVALRTIAELRLAGVSFAELKKNRSLLIPDENGEWPSRRLYAVGNRLFVSREEALAAAREVNLPEEPATVDLDAVLNAVEDAVRQLPNRRPEQIGQVTRNRWIMGGVPIIAGTRIPTETIAWFHNHGYSLTEILENFPRLTPNDVDAAIAFENGREAKTAEPILVRR